MTTTTKRERMYERIQSHGEDLLRIFPNAKPADPVKLCKRLRRLESDGERIAVDYCNGAHDSDTHEELTEALLAKVNRVLGNVHEYQPKTGARCSCRRGVERDNCPNCEGTGHVVDFRAIRNRRPLVPVFVNGDPRGYALKIRDEYVRAHNLDIHRDWGGYGIIAPDLADDC